VTSAIGYLATGITILSFIPQVVRVWRTRQTRDLSMGAFALLASGALLWFAYGLLTGDLPVIVTNASVGAMVIAIVVAKLRYG
jgi:MtN3 and saliva related transmembrane protein